jgi:DNA segregation ATPase FtsK/SpoIIIE, S-DNA-T family
MDPMAPVEELNRAISSYLGLGEGPPLRVVRSGQSLEGNAAIVELRLARGDVLALSPEVEEQEARPDTETIELVVVGGPSSGLRAPLSDGRHRLGRGADCDIRIADKALSREHLLIDVVGSKIRIKDAGSTNGTFIEGRRLHEESELDLGQVVEAGTSLLRLQRAASDPPHRRVPDEDGLIRFNRPPRLLEPPPAETFTVPNPPPEPQHTRISLATIALPVLVAVALWFLLPHSSAFIFILVLAPAVAAVSFLEERNRTRRDFAKARRAWQRELDDLEDSLQQTRSAIAEHLRGAHPEPSELIDRATGLKTTLWERDLDDLDFLSLRCGWGDRPWEPEMRFPEGGSEVLRQEARDRTSRLAFLSGVPLTVSLRELGVVGVCGPKQVVAGLARSFVLQCATLHSPEEVEIAVIANDPDEWRWTTWLPHATTGPSDNPEAAVAAALARLEQNETAGGQPALVMIVDAPMLHQRRDLAPLLREGRNNGVHVIWLAPQRDELPGRCRGVIEITGADLSIAVDGDARRATGALETVSLEDSIAVARALAPVVDAVPQDLVSPLPRSLSLLDLIDNGQDEVGVSLGWESAQGVGSPVGSSARGTFSIDLVEDGPHALIGGTTGSGKSELLQTLVAGLALHHSPKHVNLVLIDYKGGATFDRLRALPHVVGDLTDLDPGLAQRALISLNAEIRRRELVLRDVGSSQLLELERQGGDPPFPRLVLVIDEFATLIRDIPGFVEGIVDIAQRGRSLGVHLVLATQRPTGSINDAIRANTNLRIALRVADAQESREVLGLEDAAFINRTTRGRAYFRSGQGRAEEVQVASVSLSFREEKARVVVHERGTAARNEGAVGMTQLERIVSLCRRVTQTAGIPAPRPVWLPPLPKVVTLRDLVGDESQAAFGLVDRPENQRQEAVAFDPLRDRHLLIYGAPGAGKSTALRSIVGSLAAVTSPDDLHVYALDLGGGGLEPLRALEHCGDVVRGDEPERVERLLSLMERETDHRRGLANATGTPHLLLVVDGLSSTYGSDRTLEGDLTARLTRLVGDAGGAGLHLLLSAATSSSVPTALASLIPFKLVLRQSGPDGYLAADLPRDLWRDRELPPGRGFVDGHEIQIATLSSDAAPAGDREELASISASFLPTSPPARVELLPSNVKLDDLPPASERLMAPVGLSETEIAPVFADLRRGHFLVAGPYRSGRSSSLVTIATGLQRSTKETRFHVIATRPSPLLAQPGWEQTVTDLGTLEDYLDGLEALMDRAEDVLVFIDDAEELVDAPGAQSLERLIKQARDSAIRFVAAGESRALARGFGGWTAELRKDRHGLLLDPDPDVDGDLLGVRLPRTRKPHPPGRGFMVHRGKTELVQVARPLDGGREEL